jgi:hypothetical protein
LEKRKKVTNRIGAVLSIASSLGAKFFPAIVGQTVEEFPMVYMYINLGIIVGCIVIFAVLNLLTRNFVVGLSPNSAGGETTQNLLEEKQREEIQENQP